MATRANIVIDQGTTFSTFIYINDALGNPVDLTAYSVKSQMRKDYTSLNAYSFSVTGDNQGMITMSLSSNASSSIPAGRYVYDLLVINEEEGSSSRVLEGQVTINPSVSR